jgi:hypothetical protein
MTLRDWTPAEQEQHRRDLLDAVPHGNKGRRHPQRAQQPTPPKAAKGGYAKGTTLEELLKAW